MKKHMRTHSYSYVQYKCDICDFMGYDEIDMDVHAAKLHGDKHDCGLCDYEAKSLEQLEIHLSTCEYYQCFVCNEKLWQFIKIKEHFQTKHSDFDKKKNAIKNIKPSRENSDLYDQKFHSLLSLFPELND